MLHTFWFVLLSVVLYVYRLPHRIGELFSLFRVVQGNLWIVRYEWANLGIRRLDYWFRQWAETKTKKNWRKNGKITHNEFMKVFSCEWKMIAFWVFQNQNLSKLKVEHIFYHLLKKLLLNLARCYHITPLPYQVLKMDRFKITWWK